MNTSVLVKLAETLSVQKMLLAPSQKKENWLGSLQDRPRGEKEIKENEVGGTIRTEWRSMRSAYNNLTGKCEGKHS
jgi:hypothetical protein